MKRIITVLTLAFFTNTFVSYAQEKNDPILLTIDGEQILLSEFEAVYKKNNKSIDKKSLEEYLELYVKFKLKVHDAEALGMDTLQKFRKELAGYRSQLAEPYLSDNQVTEELIKEAYERLKFEIRASHIMVKLDAGATPADTLKAFKKIQEIKSRIDKGADFNSLALEVSEDPSAVENKGDLGYFSALFMVYPFETAAYTTEVGKVSKIVRSQFGYHILKITDKRPNRGEITVAHIMTRIPRDANEPEVESARMKINEIRSMLQAGDNWDEIALQYSDDKTTSNRGGTLPSFGSGRMVMEFEDASFALANDGDISAPVQTAFGFHIIKRISLDNIGTLAEMTPELKQRISRDGRSKLSKKSFIKHVKAEYGFTETAGRKTEFYKVLDSTFHQQKWSHDKAASLKKEMFKLGDTTITQTDFALYVERNQPRGNEMNKNAYLDLLYENYVESVCITYESMRLMRKYPEFKMLMKEYHDGILLFDLTDQNVWSKAVKDSAGLEAFYQAHKNEHMWGERVEATMYSCANDNVAKSVLKMVKSGEKKGFNDEAILKSANETSQLNLEILSGKYSKGDHAAIDAVEWKEGIKPNVTIEGRVYIVNIKSLLKAQPKELSEVKGLITSSYQNYLEEQWVKDLRAKYVVVVNKEYLSQIK